MQNIKTLPHSIEAEQAVLGGLMLDKHAWDKVGDVISELDFYRDEHRIIFRAISEISVQTKPVDVITVAEQLGESQLEVVGGIAYLGALVRDTPSAANIKSYADIVRENSILRQLIETSNQIIESCYSTENKDVKAILEESERNIFAIAESSNKGKEGPKLITEVLTATLSKIHEFMSSDKLTGVSTGFRDLDNMTSGMQDADLIIVAGRPSMGKTIMAMNLAEHVAIKEDLPVLVFSMEMPAEAIAMRLLSSLSSIEQNKVRTANLKDTDWARFSATVGLVSNKKLLIDDTGGLTPIEVRARARRVAREHKGLSLIVVDYLQLMRLPTKAENRATEISEISRSLKALAKELNVPVVALSQLNRSLEQRPDKRPVMSDLRDSGALEQDADLIMFIYRDEVYNPDSKDKGTAEIIIGKHRNGPVGTVRLAYNGSIFRFYDYAPEAEVPA